MLSLFSEYYRPTDKEFSHLWQDATVVFDTNVLLHLYRYTPRTRIDLLSAMDALQQRIWMPYQVGLEFSRNRAEVIIEQRDIIGLITSFHDFVGEKFKKDVVQKHGKQGHFFADLEKIQAIFQKAEQDLQEELERARTEYPDPLHHDDVTLEQLDKLFQGKIGDPYPEARLADLSVEFEKRYNQKIPPGFKDAKKNSPQQKNSQDSKGAQPQEDSSSNPANKYGDVILWYQLIDYAKQEKKPIILVGDDVKEDWWWRLHGQTLGPRPELRREMREKCDVLFYMYNTENFLKHAQEFLALQVQEETIKEIRENRIRDARVQANRLALDSGLSPSLGVYPPLTHDILMKQLEQIKKFINEPGGLPELKRQISLRQEMMQIMIEQAHKVLAQQVLDVQVYGQAIESLPDFQDSEDENKDLSDPLDDTSTGI